MSLSPLSIVYFGTAEFAITPLKALLAAPEKFRVLAVVTQPDRPAGRDGALRRSPVAQVSVEAGLPLLQFESLKFQESADVLRRLSADAFVVAAYGLIIPQAVLDIPRLGCFNLHGSLLPKYRGASPIQEALRNGDEETGVSLMRMDAQVDHGPVYKEVKVEISHDDTYLSLEAKLSAAAAPLLVDSLPRIATGELQAKIQPHELATFTKLISKDDGRVLWDGMSAVEIVRLLRAYTPWPGVFTVWEKKTGAPMRIKLLKMSLVTGIGNDLAPGTVFLDPTHGVCVKTRENAVILEIVQPEGKGAMPAKAFVQGNAGFIGTVLK